MDDHGYHQGMSIRAIRASVRVDETSPPPLFRDGDLVDVMEDISRYFDMSERAAGVLSARSGDKAGIGTARTRSAIIKGLFDRGQVEYVRSDAVRGGVGKFIRATRKGVHTYSMLKVLAPSFISPEMTARWEEMLRRVESGDLGRSEFIKAQEEYCREVAQAIKGHMDAGKPKLNVDSDGGECPKCKSGRLVACRKGRRGAILFYRCSNSRYDKDAKTVDGCTYVRWGE